LYSGPAVIKARLQPLLNYGQLAVSQPELNNKQSWDTAAKERELQDTRARYEKSQAEVEARLDERQAEVDHLKAEYEYQYLFT